jgi:hypothetical protein
LVSPALEQEQPQLVSVFPLERLDDGLAEKTPRTLSLEQKVGALFVMRLRVETLHDRSTNHFEVRSNGGKYPSARWLCRRQREDWQW